MTRSNRPLPAIALAGMLSLTTPSAFALSDVVELMDYTLGCAALMLRDPAQHVIQCNPRFPTPQLNSMIQGSSGTPPVAAPAAPPPVVLEVECPEEVLGGALDTDEVVLVASLDILIAEVDDCDDGGGEVFL